MGTDCAPLLANLFLFFYEYRYLRCLIKSDIVLARRFNNTMRYIDDLLVLNNTNFSDAIQDINPSELQPWAATSHLNQHTCMFPNLYI